MVVAGSCMKMAVVAFAHVDDGDGGDEWLLWWLVVGGCVASHVVMAEWWAAVHGDGGLRWSWWWLHIVVVVAHHDHYRSLLIYCRLHVSG